MSDGSGIVVRELAVGLLECRAFGHLELEHVVKAQGEIDALLATGARYAAAIFDGRENVSFEPGLPVRWVRWGSTRGSRFSRLAIVARPGPMTAVAATIPYLLPTARVRVFTSRDDALAWLRSSLPSSTTVRDQQV